MSIIPWRSEGPRDGTSPESQDSTLEPEVQTTLSWSSRLFEISDLNVEKEARTEVFLSTFKLDPVDGNSGETQNPVTPVQLSLKAEGREISLLSGLLNRHCRILELKQTRVLNQNRVLQELQELRDENLRLKGEVSNLYGALELLQRPRMIS